MAKRILIVTGQKPITTVGTKSGGQSTLYEVYATDERGEIVEEPLRAFTELEEGVPVEYDIERYVHEKYGTSYTLIPPRRNSAKRLREVEEQLERLVTWAEAQGFNPAIDYETRGEPAPREPEPEPVTEPVPAPERADLDEKFGEDPPWNDDDLETEKTEDMEL